MSVDTHEKFMRRAIELAQKGVDESRGGPFGCVVVKNDEIIGEGCNEVTSTNDPTAHAEIVAVRNACKALNSFQLEGCTVYTSCEPCPMCLGAIFWARPKAIFMAATRDDAAAAGFDDEVFYSELEKPNEARELKMESLLREESQAVFKRWIEKPNKVEY
jgi:tRNA(Arg) A34 adenosine deaminase TadA